jgi:hypothetical protein
MSPTRRLAGYSLTGRDSRNFKTERSSRARSDALEQFGSAMSLRLCFPRSPELRHPRRGAGSLLWLSTALVWRGLGRMANPSIGSAHNRTRDRLAQRRRCDHVGGMTALHSTADRSVLALLPQLRASNGSLDWLSGAMLNVRGQIAAACRLRKNARRPLDQAHRIFVFHPVSVP